MKIFGDLGSGNCLKVKYTADHLGLPYTWEHVDIMKGETRTPESLTRFPLGRIPAVEFDDGRRLAESNAIIRYLARGSALLPDDAFVQAKIDELLFWEQYSHEPYVATTRYHMVYLKRSLDQREAWRVERGEAALDLMNRLLGGQEWLVGKLHDDCRYCLAALHAAGARRCLRACIASGGSRLDCQVRGCSGLAAGGQDVKAMVRAVTRSLEHRPVGAADPIVDLVGFLEGQEFDDLGGQPDRERTAPSFDFHRSPPGSTHVRLRAADFPVNAVLQGA